MALFKCKMCGGDLAQKNGSTVVECEYCGSTYVMENDETIVEKTRTDAKIVEHYLEASKFELKNNHAEELKALSKALDIDPNSALTFVKLGRCYRKLGMQDKAINAYKRALEIDPRMGTAYTNLGTICILNKNYQEAAEQYEKGLHLIEKNEDDYWTSYANYAIAVAHLGDPAKAESMIKESEQHGYKNGDSCRQLAGIKKQGCYIATAVYGSYDCPQVWILRRYRDYTLARTWYGRAFVRTYYAISPTLVKWFGHNHRFRKMWKGTLDHIVTNLAAEGVEGTPYKDRNW